MKLCKGNDNREINRNDKKFGHRCPTDTNHPTLTIIDVAWIMEDLSFSHKRATNFDGFEYRHFTSPTAYDRQLSIGWLIDLDQSVLLFARNHQQIV